MSPEVDAVIRSPSIRSAPARRWILLVVLVAATSVASLGLRVATVRAALAAVANPDTLSTPHDRTRVVPAPGVLANDTNLLGGTTAVLATTTTHGSLSLAANGGYTYTPNAGFLGTDVFRYHDSGLLTNTTTVTITVTNAAPVARPETYQTTTGVTLTVVAPGVLGNDTDADGDAIQAQLVDGSGNGSLSLSSSGRLVFTSGGSFSGTRTFTYRVTDGLASSNVATGSIDVTPPAPTPTPTPTPVPTAAPTPAPTVPLPTVPLPTVPLPTVPTPTVPLPTSPTSTPRPTSSPSTTSVPPSSPDPGSASPVPPAGSGPSAAPNGGVVTGQPGSPGGSAPPGGSGASAATGPFDVQVGDGSPFSGLGDLGVLRFGGLFEWAVPSLVLTVPGLLLILVVLAQLFGGAIWLPFARRSLGSFGVGRRKRRSRTGATA